MSKLHRLNSGCRPSHPELCPENFCETKNKNFVFTVTFYYATILNNNGRLYFYDPICHHGITNSLVFMMLVQSLTIRGIAF